MNELAAQLTASPKWQWVPGMLTAGAQPQRITLFGRGAGIPDLSDLATIGILTMRLSEVGPWAVTVERDYVFVAVDDQPQTGAPTLAEAVARCLLRHWSMAPESAA